MKKAFLILAFTAVLLSAGCGKVPTGSTTAAESPVSDMPSVESQTVVTEPPQQDLSILEQAALTAYTALLSGDRTLLDDGQMEAWWMPDFQDGDLLYEYTCMDLDSGDIPELLIQMTEDPYTYNAVFHFEDGRLVCWNSDGLEGSCRDYPLKDGSMVRQYDVNGSRSYTLFRYQSGGEAAEISCLFAREESFPDDSAQACPYYEIDGTEVDKTTFYEHLDARITARLLDRSAWTPCKR